MRQNPDLFKRKKAWRKARRRKNRDWATRKAESKTMWENMAKRETEARQR